MRQILSEDPKTGILGIHNPNKYDYENLTDEQAEQRALDHITNKTGQLNVRFSSTNTILYETNREFRNGLRDNAGIVFFNMPECKTIAHGYRRASRDAEMKPYDDIIAKDIPGQDKAAAEVERAKLRTKYDGIQVDIDNATTVDDLMLAIL